jgi:hypothetical protein
MPRAHHVVCLVLTVALGSLGCAHAGHTGSENAKYSITLKVAEQLKKVGEYAQEKKFDAALAEIDRISEHKYLNPYERAMLSAMRAGIHLALNKNDEVIKDMEQAVAPHAMPEAQQLDAEFNLAQAYFVMERFSESADTFSKWAERAKDVEASKYYVVASAFSQAHRYAEALPYAQKAVDGTKEPKEPWLQLLLSLHFELKQDEQVAATLEKLIAAFPKTEYWLQLSATYQAMGQDKKALATLETARSKGLLTEEKDQVSLARFYLQQGAPLKAAAVLEKVSKTPEINGLLAQCWIMGKDADRGEAALKAAGEEAAPGGLYLDLAYLRAEHGDWAKSRDAAAMALQRGGLKAPGEAHLLLGVAHYKTKRKDVALAALAEAKRDPATAGCADEWIKAVKGGRPDASAGCAPGAASSKSAKAARK